MAQSISSTRMGPSAVAGTVPQPPKVGIGCWQGQSRSRAPILIPCGPPHLLHPTRPPPAPATSWRAPWYLGDRKQWPWATHLYPGLRGGMPQLWMRSAGCPKKPARVPGWWHGSAPGSVEALGGRGHLQPQIHTGTCVVCGTEGIIRMRAAGATPSAHPLVSMPGDVAAAPGWPS